MKKTASKVSSRPCISTRLDATQRYRAEPASSLGRKFAILECESLTKNSVAPPLSALDGRVDFVGQ